jgi:hypothetical protein
LSDSGDDGVEGFTTRWLIAMAANRFDISLTFAPRRLLGQFEAMAARSLSEYGPGFPSATL